MKTVKTMRFEGVRSAWLGLVAMCGVTFAAGAATTLLDPGEKLTIRAADHPKFRSASEYRVWCRKSQMPAAALAANKAKIFQEIQWEFHVLGILDRVTGRPPEELTVDLAAKGLSAPGDYRISVALPSGWQDVDVRLRRPALKADALAWRLSADGIRWRMTNDADVVLLEAACAEKKSVSVFLDPKGTGVEVRRVTVSPDGSVRDLLAVDDNHNTDTFVPDATWRSRAKAVVTPDGAGWKLSLRVPVGALGGVPRDMAAVWGANVSYAERVTKALTYPRVRTAPVPANLHGFEVVTPKISAAKRDGALELCVESLLVNGEPNFRLLKARLSLESPEGGAVDSAETDLALAPSKSTTLKFELGRGKIACGQKARLRWEIFSAEGLLEAVRVSEFDIVYEPTTVAWIAPGYHDCVFDSMKLEKVVGEVRLEEGIGRPLEIRFEGPDRTDRLTIAAAAATNRFSFAIAGRPFGDYFVRVGNVTKRLRKLPPKKDEIWIDDTGVVRVAGEKILPLGWFSDPFRRRSPEVNITVVFNDSIHTAEGLKEILDAAWKNGCRALVNPLQDMRCGPHSQLVGSAAMKRGFGDGEFAAARRKAVSAFVAAAKDHPGFFGYFLWDEPEGAGFNPEFFAGARALLEELDPYHPTYINNYTTAGTVRFGHCADILGLDIYPIFTCDAGTSLASRMKPYEPLKHLAKRGKTSFWTPQAFDWDYFSPKRMTRGPTYPELREQTFLGFAADVRGLVFYSAFSSRVPGYDIPMGVTLLGEELLAAKDLFLAPNVADFTWQVQEKGANLAAALKVADGQAMIIAINTQGKAFHVEFRSASLPAAFYVGGRPEALPVKGGVFADTLQPYETKVYYSYAGGFDFEAARRKVAAAEAARRKPGNLAVAAKFPTMKQLKLWREGKYDNGYPKIVPTSATKVNYGVHSPYMLQDGIADEFPLLPYHAWSPEAKDKAPAVTVDFGAKKRFSRVVVTRAVDKPTDGRSPVRAIAVEVGGREVGAAVFVSGKPATVEFPSVEAEKVTVKVTDADRAVKCPWLAEIEVY